MEILPPNSSCLELSIAMPSFPSSEAKGKIKLLDINEAPSRSEEECVEEEDEDSPVPRKKLRLTKDQSRRLEQSFVQNQTLNPKEKEDLAMELRLKPRQVEVWFQNRRARSKMKQTEVECEYLKRWLGALTEQNRKLQKEVEELRFIKAAPPRVSALSMCPRCERVTPAASYLNT
ncbi:homeobox-leucine zipper protein ATHB-17-like [Salvia hispanica]|uniref:homeobox-leucine zipper protein ATHB-17-like n=1 Tax=Salvia hispanica TaxID=49212 RepID=UPI0020099F16|nr:homeobox-leucine zipper protein ATHB-17-like [Salvia hispanica]